MATNTKKKNKKTKKIDELKKAKKVKKVGKSKKAKKIDARKGQPGTHPPHPKCPKCEKAMYKTMVKGKAVAKEDPFAFCRNPDCELYGVDQDGNASEENKLGAKATGMASPAKKTKRTLPKKVPVKKASKKSKSKGDDKGKTPKTDKIKAALLKGKLTQAEIAAKFDCSRKKVRAVRNVLQDEGLL